MLPLLCLCLYMDSKYSRVIVFVEVPVIYFSSILLEQKLVTED